MAAKPRLPTPPKHFIGYARRYHAALVSLADDDLRGLNDHLVPIGFLLGFALEFALKAIWLAANGDEKQSFDWSHKIDLIYQGCLSKDFAPSNPKALGELINIMAPLHRDFTFRYLPENPADTVLARNEWAIPTLETLISDAEAQFNVWQLHAFGIGTNRDPGRP